MDCSSIIPDVNYSGFSARLHREVASKRIPAGGSIDLTSRCNLRCVHCYVRSSTRQQELSLAEIERIFDELSAAGCLWLLLTGGEPLLRPDFSEIYLLAKKKGFLINLFTNAVLVNEDIAAMLAEWRPFAVEVTLYGATAETYERVTGVPGSFRRCLDGINLLRDKNIPLRFKSMLLTINSHELGRMMALAESLGGEFRYDGNIHGHLGGSREPCRFRLTPEQILELDVADSRRIDALREFLRFSSQFTRDPKRIYHCGAGINSFHIDSQGRLCLCMLSRRESFDLCTGTFAEGWQEFLARVRFQETKGANACAACKLYDLCGQCPGWGEIEDGDPEQSSEFLCRLAHLRSAVLGGEIFPDSPD